MRHPTLLLLGLLLLLAASPTARAQGRIVGEYDASDPSAPPVTLDNVLENDRFWPFRVTIVEDFTPPGASEPLPKIPGVLIRVESRETLRMDFGRFGRHQVPVSATDLIERVNRVRLGEESKMAPNLLLTIGNKLLDSAGERIRPFPLLRDAKPDALLCVFADPASEGFEALAAELRALAAREGTQTLLFPQSELKDIGVRRRLRALDWKIPYVLYRFSRLYARSIAGEETPFPHWMLLTRDGRVLHRGPFAPGVSAEIEAALPPPGDAESATRGQRTSTATSLLTPLRSIVTP